MNTKEFNLNTNIGLNDYIDNSLLSEVKEVVKHFSSRFRKYEPTDVDKEYFYKFEQVKKFEELYEIMYNKKFEEYLKKNPQKTLQDFEMKFERAKIKPIYFNENNSKPSCWCVYRDNLK